MFKIVVLVITFGGFLLVSGLVFAEGPNISEGMWEITSKSRMEGLPYPMPEMSFKMKQCLTKEDFIPKTKEKEENCKITDKKISGNNVKWTVRCEDNGETSVSEGDITYTGSSYKGTIKTTVTDKNGSVMKMNSEMTGKMIGPCK